MAGDGRLAGGWLDYGDSINGRQGLADSMLSILRTKRLSLI